MPTRFPEGMRACCVAEVFTDQLGRALYKVNRGTADVVKTQPAP